LAGNRPVNASTNCSAAIIAIRERVATLPLAM
jgi:hypothetical protein